jgi:hypothetical protein
MKHNRIQLPRGLTRTKTKGVRQLAGVTGAALTGCSSSSSLSVYLACNSQLLDYWYLW